MLKRSAQLTALALFVLIACVDVRAADPGAPAEFRVLPTVERPNKFLFTATIGKIPTNTIAYGSFEPFVFRHKWELRGDADNKLILDKRDWPAYRIVKGGFWDGARVRVYRVRNGRLVRVRDDRVADGGHAASGWQQYKLGRKWENLVAPDTTRVRLNIPGHWRMNVPYYYRVVAVREDGATAPATPPVSVTPAEGSRGKEVIKTVQVEGVEIGVADKSLSGPRGLKGAIDPEGGLVLTWHPADMENLAGYRIEISTTPPDEHRGFHMRLAGRAGRDGQEALKEGDLAFISKIFTDYSRRRYLKPTSWGARNFGELMSHKPRSNSFVRFFGDEEPEKAWSLVEHPEPVPVEFADGGQTCLRLDLEREKTADIMVGRHGTPEGDWYMVLKPNTDYVVEARIRAEDQAQPVTFNYSSKAEPLEFRPDGSWKLLRTTFNSGPLGSLVGNPIEPMTMTFTGPATYWVDNTRVYPADEGYLRPAEMGLRRAREADLHAVRYHNHIKSGYSYTMEMLTNPRGVVGKRGVRDSNNPDTLPALLDYTRNVGANPWMQIEMCMSEEEWLGLVEYLAAPYDPASDTPAEKPWAYKRYRQGQREPWADEFDRLYFEISNETWNWSFDPWIFYPGHVDEATGRMLDRGETYGMLHRHVTETMRSSPYWTDEMEAKWEDVLGGWSANAGDSQGGYGPNAVLGAPEAQHLTIAAYNGGWDVGEQAAKMTDDSLFRSATFFIQHDKKAAAPIEVRARQLAADLTPYYEFGTYEAGPGYALPGRTTEEQSEAQDQVGKSLATGIATLDTFAGRASLGYRLQSFFTMTFGRRHWTAFAPMHKGGHPYPSWMALVLFNQEAGGDFLVQETVSVPSADLKEFAKRPERKDAPLVAVYPTVDGDRVNVLVLSRKVDRVLDENGDGRVDAQDDGWTPVTLHLPFERAGSVTLHKMVGDPRWHNLDEQKVKIETTDSVPFGGPTFELTRRVTGLERDGLPPSGALLYVFEDTDIKVNRPPEVTVQTPVNAQIGEPKSLEAEATDPDGDEVELSWDLGDAGTWDAGKATFTSSGRHEVYAVADDGEGGITRKLCLVEAALEGLGHKWALMDPGTSTEGLPPVSCTGNRVTIPVTGNFRYAPWLYAGDVRLEERGSVTMRLVGEPSKRGEMLAGISLRGQTTDWKLWRTPHVSLVFMANPKEPDNSDIYLDDLRNVGRNPEAAVSGWSLPVWLRIVRKGNTFTGLASKDGRDWERIGVIDGPARALPGRLYVGVVGGSDHGSEPAVVTVEDFRVENR